MDKEIRDLLLGEAKDKEDDEKDMTDEKDEKESKDEKKDKKPFPPKKEKKSEKTDEEDEELTEEGFDISVTTKIPEAVVSEAKENGLTDETLKTIREMAESTLVVKLDEMRTQVVEQANQSLLEHKKTLEEAFEVEKANQVEAIDYYLSECVKSWMEENKLAVEQGITSEIAEDFLDSIKTTMLEHNIDVPEHKIDVVEEQALKIRQQEQEINDLMEQRIVMRRENESMMRNQIVEDCGRKLNSLNRARLNKLTEMFEYDNEESFRTKVEDVVTNFNLKESTVNQTVSEDVADDTETLIENVVSNTSDAEEINRLAEIISGKY